MQSYPVRPVMCEIVELPFKGASVKPAVIRSSLNQLHVWAENPCIMTLAYNLNLAFHLNSKCIDLINLKHTFDANTFANVRLDACFT